MVVCRSIKEQSGSVSEYYDNFMAYAESISVSDPELLVSSFINGLQLQIYGQVINKRPKPKTMIQAWFSARMCEMKLEEEKQADPEIPTTIPEIQHNSDSEIQVNSANPDAEIQNSEQVEAEPENQQSESEINNGVTATIQHTSSKFTKNITPQLKSRNQNRSQFQSQEDEDEIDELNNYSEIDDRSVTVVKPRPPPEPPDSKGKVEADDATKVNGDGLAEIGKAADLSGGCLADVVADGTKSSAEVGPSVRGMCTSSSAAGRTTVATVEDDAMVILGEPAVVEILEANHTRSLEDGGEQETTSGAEDDAVAETGRRTSAAFEDGEAMEKKNGAATVTNGGLRARQLRRCFLLNPPPLLAAVLP
ncbi:hypothetical protein PIB30_039883 [Stylosanthes scabra]|uniref:Retrotransposon gag domain-containing protein n=1 Tax=Stylosanthes scabra TaxID=79078 RepID=A0ABU6WCL8_9FABA|nr:hypothetical protein [Stylosanthes scabra]